MKKAKIFITTMMESHKFFVEMSESYMKGTNKFYYYLKYPMAYFKFMWWMTFDNLRGLKEL